MTLNKLKELYEKSTRGECSGIEIIEALHNAFPDIAADYEAMKAALRDIAHNNCTDPGNYETLARAVLANLRCKDSP